MHFVFNYIVFIGYTILDSTMVFCSCRPPYLGYPPLPRPPRFLPALVPPHSCVTSAAHHLIPPRHAGARAAPAATVGDGIRGGTLTGVDDVIKEVVEVFFVSRAVKVVCTGCS